MNYTVRPSTQGGLVLRNAASPSGAPRKSIVVAPAVATWKQRKTPIVIARVATRPGSSTLQSEASAAAEALERSLALTTEGNGSVGALQEQQTSAIDSSSSKVAPLASTSSTIASPISSSSLADRKNPGASADELASTWEHRAWVAGTALLLSALAAQGVQKCLQEGTEGGGLTSVALALGGSYLLSDFLTAVYHWSVDNYGDGSTPIVGGQIAAFQGHHQVS
jgi:hypothetical protein